MTVTIGKPSRRTGVRGSHSPSCYWQPPSMPPPPPRPPALPVTSVKYGNVAVLVLLSAASTAAKSVSIVERSDDVMFEDVMAAASAL